MVGRNNSFKMKRFNFTKKKINLLRKFRWGITFNSKFQKQKLLEVSRTTALFKLETFLNLSRQFIKKIYSMTKDKALKALHKRCLKKSKKRLYFQNLVITLERRVTSLLFLSKLVTQIKYVKQLSLHNFIYKNRSLSRGYSTYAAPLDFIHLHQDFYKKSAVKTCVFGLFDFRTRGYLRVFYNKILKNLIMYRKIYLLKLKKRFLLFKKSSLLQNFVKSYVLFKSYWSILTYQFQFYLSLKVICFNRRYLLNCSYFSYKEIYSLTYFFIYFSLFFRNRHPNSIQSLLSLLFVSYLI